MIELSTIREIAANAEQLADQEVRVGGWIRSTRDSKTFAFIVLHDGSRFEPLQVVIHENLPNFKEVAALNVGSALIVQGILKLTPEAQQPFEVQAESVQIEGASAPDYPLQKKRHGLEFLRTMPHLRVRTNTFLAVFRVRSLVARLIHDFFGERGFVYVHTPIITGSDAEGAGEMFRVTTLDLDKLPLDAAGKIDQKHDFFGQSTHLTVSGQLDVEAFASAFGRVYTFGPTFRAENSNTARHAAEFWMIEPEMAFADLEDDMALAEALVKYIINGLLAEAPDEMAFFDLRIDPGLIERLQTIASAEFAHVSYTEAIELLQPAADTFTYPVAWGIDLQTEHERYLTETVFKKPVFVTDYPKDIKAFYMKLNADNKTVAAMDLLVPLVGEIMGGSQREDDYQKLLTRIQELGLSRDEYAAYLDLRRFGTVRHAGFGLGFERLIMYVTGMGNIRDVLPYPRTPGSL